MYKENMVYLYIDYYSVVKNNYIMKIEGKWLKLEKKGILTKVTQTQKGKYDMYSIISVY